MPTFKHTYFKSKNGQVTITSINYDGQTYITYGKYERNRIPDNYIKPIYAGVNDGFEAILYFEGDTAILYARYGRFDSIGTNNKLKVKKFDRPGIDTLFVQMLNDSSGQYQLLHD